MSLPCLCCHAGTRDAHPVGRNCGARFLATVTSHVWTSTVCALPLYKLPFHTTACQAWILTFPIGLPRALAMAFIAARCFKAVEAIFQRLQEFGTKAAKCAREADRPLAQSSVEAFVNAYEDVPADAKQETSLDVFNDIVYRDMPRLRKQSLGPVGT